MPTTQAPPVKVDDRTKRLRQMTLREVVTTLESEARNETFSMMRRTNAPPDHRRYKILALKSLALKLDEAIKGLERAALIEAGRDE